MKKLAAFLTLILLAVFVISACTPDQSESTANSIVESIANSNVSKAPTESTANSSQTSESNVTSQPAESAEKPTAPIYNPVNPDDIKVRFTYCTAETLKQYDSIIEYTDNIGTEDIIFIADEEISNFSFISIKWETDGAFEKSNPSVDKILFSVDFLNPAKPLVIKKTNIPEITGSYRGITFKDKEGNEKFYYIAYSGRDGLVFYEFDNNILYGP